MAIDNRHRPSPIPMPPGRVRSGTDSKSDFRRLGDRVQRTRMRRSFGAWVVRNKWLIISRIVLFLFGAILLLQWQFPFVLPRSLLMTPSVACQRDPEGSWAVSALRGASPFQLELVGGTDIFQDDETQTQDTEESRRRIDTHAYHKEHPAIYCNSVMDVASNFVADPFLFQPTFREDRAKEVLKEMGELPEVIRAEDLDDTAQHPSTWIRSDEPIYAFYEVKVTYNRRGEVGAARSIDGGVTWIDLGIVLREPFHLSYPFVIQEGNEIFMVPEASAIGVIPLYKALDFPYHWRRLNPIVDKPYIDCSFLRHNGKLWLFCGMKGTGSRELHVLWSRSGSVKGPWVEHPMNPVNVDHNARGPRPGGRPFVFNDRIFRPGQDCSNTYGGDIILHAVSVLEEDDFVETPLGPANGVARGKWSHSRFHHLDIRQDQTTTQFFALADGDAATSGAEARNLMFYMAALVIMTILSTRHRVLRLLLRPVKAAVHSAQYFAIPVNQALVDGLTSFDMPRGSMRMSYPELALSDFDVEYVPKSARAEHAAENGGISTLGVQKTLHRQPLNNVAQQEGVVHSPRRPAGRTRSRSLRARSTSVSEDPFLDDSDDGAATPSHMRITPGNISGPSTPRGSLSLRRTGSNGHVRSPLHHSNGVPLTSEGGVLGFGLDIIHLATEAVRRSFATVYNAVQRMRGIDPDEHDGIRMELRRMHRPSPLKYRMEEEEFRDKIIFYGKMLFLLFSGVVITWYFMYWGPFMFDDPEYFSVSEREDLITLKRDVTVTGFHLPEHRDWPWKELARPRRRPRRRYPVKVKGRGVVINDSGKTDSDGSFIFAAGEPEPEPIELEVDEDGDLKHREQEQHKNSRRGMNGNGEIDPGERDTEGVSTVLQDTQCLTIIMQTYAPRTDELFQTVQHYGQCVAICQFVILWQPMDPEEAERWNRTHTPPTSESLNGLIPSWKRLVVVPTEENSLHNKFRAEKYVPESFRKAGEAYYLVDDDILVPCSAIYNARLAWLHDPVRIYGFFPRLIAQDGPQFQFEYHWEGEARSWGTYNSILTGAAIVHRRLLSAYVEDTPPHIEAYIDEHMNCEDLWFNVLAALYTQRAPVYIPAAVRNRSYFSDNASVSLSKRTEHNSMRSVCARYFAEEFGGDYLPLKGNRFY
eukprot:Clim_evm13s149 gene=Clim_evmTU13s149